MAKNQEPVVLELAPLPREQIGPFLLLGLDKDADREQVEASWARCVIWARKKQTTIVLEDINWAREVLNDPERRVQADTASLNPDTVEGVLRRLTERHAAPGWQPLEAEKPLRDYVPDIPVHDPRAVRATIEAPAVPEEVPAAVGLLRQLAEQPIDPWALPIPADADPDHPKQDPAP